MLHHPTVIQKNPQEMSVNGLLMLQRFSWAGIAVSVFLKKRWSCCCGVMIQYKASLFGLLRPVLALRGVITKTVIQLLEPSQ